MRETKVETYLCDEVEKRGGLCEKHVSPGLRGVPDRLITWMFAHMDLAETKATGKKPRPNQIRDHKRRAKLGVEVHVLDTKEKVDAYIQFRRPLWRIKDE